MSQHRILTLVRHAKSNWGDPGTSDIDRPLNKRGLHDAPLMAEWLSGRIERPDLILSSPAQRARTTAEKIAGAFGIETGEIRLEEWIYYRGAREWLEGIQGLGDGLAQVMLVGHMPTISEVGAYLLSGSYLGFSTCTACCLELPIDSWTLAGNDPARQLFVQSPKDLD